MTSGRDDTAPGAASGPDPPDCSHCGAGAPPGANFCPLCGGRLRGPDCPRCGAPSSGADRFCTRCGAGLPGPPPWATTTPGAATTSDDAPSRGAAAPREVGHAPASERAPSGWTGAAPWAVAGVAVAGLLTLVLLLVLRDGGGQGNSGLPPSAGQAPPLGPTSAVDLSAMTPREAAERLFNRVMTAVEADNPAEAERFLPMALAAYDRIGALSLDDRFHLSLLHAAAGDGAQASAVAEAGLAVRPTHLLCLAAAAEGALLLGDSATAAAHYRTFVDSYDDELRTGLTEYTSREAGHPDLLPVLLAEARAYLDGR